jgi:hypothetical protein
MPTFPSPFFSRISLSLAMERTLQTREPDKQRQRRSTTKPYFTKVFVECSAHKNRFIRPPKESNNEMRLSLPHNQTYSIGFAHNVYV